MRATHRDSVRTLATPRTLNCRRPNLVLIQRFGNSATCSVSYRWPWLRRSASSSGTRLCRARVPSVPMMMRHLAWEKLDSEGPSSKIAATSSGGASPGGSSSVPSPEVSDKPRRRGFTVEYKLSVLKKADACTKPGELGTLLRREGLYSSTLSGWRRQRRQGTLAALRAKKRGRKAPSQLPKA